MGEHDTDASIGLFLQSVDGCVLTALPCMSLLQLMQVSGVAMRT